MKKGGLNTPAKFGHIADRQEREAVSAVISRNFEDRSAGRWGAQCATYAAAMVERAEVEARKKRLKGTCANGLRAAAQPLSRTKAVRANTLVGPVDVFRVKGDEGVALYHGTQHTDYAMPMRKEGGEWKLASFLSIVVP
jgi:hypothetical protein